MNCGKIDQVHAMSFSLGRQVLFEFSPNPSHSKDVKKVYSAAT